MRPRLHRIAAAILLFPVPAAFPYGGHGHRLVNRAAVDNLPSAMVDDGSGRAFGAARRYLERHASDPDRRKSSDWRERARHWCDIDAHPRRYPPPFGAVPRDYRAYVKAFGRANGVLQWEGIGDYYSALAAAMRARHWPLAFQLASELGHYVADAGSPLHCTANHDGDRSSDSRNRGIHARCESGLISRSVSAVRTAPGSASRVADPVALGFDMVVSGNALVARIMAADLEAQDAAGGAGFGEGYYAELAARIGEDAQARIDLSARRLADLWYSAWDEAGRPSFACGAPWFDCPGPWLLRLTAGGVPCTFYH